jgi:MFS family permease
VNLEFFCAVYYFGVLKRCSVLLTKIYFWTSFLTTRAHPYQNRGDPLWFWCDLSLLRFIGLNWNIKKLLAGQTLSVVGTTITDRALPILMSAISGNSSTAADIKAAATFPLIFLTPILGVWAEGTKPRSLVWFNCLFAIASVVLVVGFGVKSVGLITLALFAAQVIGSVFDPLYKKAIVNFTDQGEGAKVSKVESILSRLGTSGGEFAAPWLATTIGALAFAFDAVSFVLAAIIAITLPATFGNSAQPETALVTTTPRSRSAIVRLKAFPRLILEGWSAIDKGLLFLLLAAFPTWMAEGFVLTADKALLASLTVLFVVKAVSEVVTSSLLLKTGWEYSDSLLAISGLVLGLSGFVMAIGVNPGSGLVVVISVFVWTIPVPLVAVLGMVLSGIGSNIVGGGVHSRLYYADPEVTARVSALVKVGEKVAEITTVLLVTRINDATAPAMSFVTAGCIMTITTLLVFGLRRRSSN